jgi:hypothetical protein
MRAGAFMPEIQRAFSYPATAVNVRNANVAFFFTLDVAAWTARGGARALRVAGLEQGWLSQALSLSLTDHGLFARPARSFSEDGIAALLELSDDQLTTYMLLSGVNHFPNLSLDISPSPPLEA